MNHSWQIGYHGDNERSISNLWNSKFWKCLFGKSHQVSRLWLVSFWSSEQFTGLEVENTPPPPVMNRVKISSWYCIFESRFEIRSLKLTLTQNFSLIHPKWNKQWRFSTFLVIRRRDIKMMIMTSYFWIRNDVIFLKFYKIFTHRIFLPSFSIIWLESEKIFGKSLSMIDYFHIQMNSE